MEGNSLTPVDMASGLLILDLICYGHINCTIYIIIIIYSRNKLRSIIQQADVIYHTNVGILVSSLYAMT